MPPPNTTKARTYRFSIGAFSVLLFICTNFLMETPLVILADPLTYLTNKWPFVLFTILISLVADFLLTRITRVAQFADSFDCSMNDIREILHLTPQHILSGGPGTGGSLADAFHALVQAFPEKRGMIFAFVVHSFNTIRKRGFVVFKENVLEYVEYLKAGIEVTSATAFASCCVRPFWFLVDPDRTVGGMIRSVGYAHRGGHLRLFRDGDHIPRRVRLVSLCDREIGYIIADVMTAVVVPTGAAQALAKPYDDLPEISWFVHAACNAPGDVRLYWSRQPFPRDQDDPLGDRMIFDGQLSLGFVFTDEAEGEGHTTLSWGNSDEERDVLKRSRDYLKRVFDAADGRPIDAFWRQTFPSFKSLLTDEGLDKAVKVVNETIAGLPGNVKVAMGVSQLVDQKVSGRRLSDVYDSIMAAINSGALIYNGTVTITLLGAEGAKRPRVCPWIVNSERLGIGTDYGL